MVDVFWCASQGRVGLRQKQSAGYWQGERKRYAMRRDATRRDCRKQKEVVVGRTYDRSRGVAGVDPLRLCAKVATPPSCLDGFGTPAEPMGTLPPNAHPALLFTGIAAHLHQHPLYQREDTMQGLGLHPSAFVSLPSLPFGNRLAPALPVCCVCWLDPNPLGIPLRGGGKLPAQHRLN